MDDPTPPGARRPFAENPWLAAMPAQKFRFLHPESKRRAPDYGSRAMQRKLFALLACLFAILWCMQQAARPETWQWLVNLDRAAKAQREAAGNLPVDPFDPSSVDLSHPPAVKASGESASSKSATEAAGAIGATGAASSAPSADPDQPPPNLPWSLEAVFWQLALSRLTPEQQYALADVSEMWADTELPQVRPDPVLISALTRLANLRQGFDRQVTNAAAGTASGGTLTTGANDSSSDEADADLTAELPTLAAGPAVPQIFNLPPSISLEQAQAINDQSRWLALFWNPLLQSADYQPSEQPSNTDGSATDPPSADPSSPVLVAPQGLDQWTLERAVVSRRQWRRLRTEFFEPHWLQQVADGSRLGRPEERPAWLSLVQQLGRRSRETSASSNTAPSNTASNTTAPSDAAPSHAAPNPKASVVTRQNLMGQPETFRGQWVRLTGTIRRVESVRQRDPVVGRYAHAEEYAVLWIQPGVGGQGPYCVYGLDNEAMRSLLTAEGELRRPATVEGWFFKLLPYTTAGGQTALCPLLLATDVRLHSLTPDAPATPLTYSQWGLAVGGVLVVAIGLALAGWSLTRYGSANPLGERKRRAAQVRWLAQAPVIDPRQVLRDLAESATADRSTPDAAAADKRGSEVTDEPL